jgi:Domain of unknown function (DUF4136)
MKRVQCLGASLVLLLLITGIAFAQDVKTDYDHHVNFDQFHTYSWAKVQTDDPLWQSRITDPVDKELQSKGWQKVENGGQVLLTAVGAVHNQQQYQTFYDGFGPGWWWGGMGNEATTQVQNYRVGTLVLDMYDAQNHHLIWRGTATDTLTNKTEKNENKLDKAVAKMFKDFPPKEK